MEVRKVRLCEVLARRSQELGAEHGPWIYDDKMYPRPEDFTCPSFVFPDVEQLFGNLEEEPVYLYPNKDICDAGVAELCPQLHPDLAANSWTHPQPTPIECPSCLAAALKNKVYVRFPNTHSDKVSSATLNVAKNSYLISKSQVAAPSGGGAMPSNYKTLEDLSTTKALSLQNTTLSKGTPVSISYILETQENGTTKKNLVTAPCLTVD